LSTVEDAPVALTSPYRVWDFSPGAVWVLDGSATIHTYDGTRWAELTAPSPVNCIYALSLTDVRLCSGTSVLQYNGDQFTNVDVGIETTAIYASSSSDYWVVGDSATAMHFDGSSMASFSLGGSFQGSVWGSGPNDIYVLGTFGFEHFDGSAFTEIEIDGISAGGDGQVWGTAANDVWLANGDDRIYHFDGAAWTASDELNDISAIWGSGPNSVWAAGSAGYIAHFDGSWHQLHMQKIGAPYLQDLLAVHGSAQNDVWIVGRQLGEGGSTGLLYHLD